MSKYIDLDDTIHILAEEYDKHDPHYTTGEYIRKGLFLAKELIRLMPAADVAEVVHGKWEFEPNLFDENTYRCSVCGEVWTLISGTLKENNMNFCMRCGAKMDGGKANE